jgi:hypothetical protein
LEPTDEYGSPNTPLKKLDICYEADKSPFLLLPVGLLVAILAGCSAATHTNLPPIPTNRATTKPLPTTNATAKTTLRLVVPSSTTTNVKRRHALSIAYNTAGLVITIYKSPAATYPTPVYQKTVDVSTASSLCSSQAGGGRTCTISIAAPTGTDDFLAATYDLAPVSGAITAAAHGLGVGLTASILSFSTGTFPAQIAVDPNGFIYVGDMQSNQVTKYTALGTLVLTIPVSTPYGLALDTVGNIYTGDWTYNPGTINKFTSTGAAGTPAAITSGLGYPSGIAVY